MRYLTAVLIIFALSVPINGDQGDTVVMVGEKILGVNNTFDKQIAIVNVTTNNPGHIVYLEEYFTLNDSGQPTFYKRQKLYEDNMQGNSLLLKVTRSLDEKKNPYLVNAVIILDNKTFVKSLEFNDDITIDRAEGSNKKNQGIGITAVMTILAIIYIMKKKK